MMSLRPSFRAAALALSAVAVAAAAYAATTPAPAAKPAAPATLAAPAGVTKGDATKGAAKYKVMCVACHKADGSGGFKSTGNPTPNWTLKKTWDATRTEGFFRNCITNGNAKSGMVAWGKTGALKPQEIEDVIAFILTHKAKAK
jgi:mono/diheme cytochrome c family protein